MSGPHKVNVYDAGNRSRLLGFIYQPHLGPRQGKSWKFATFNMQGRWWTHPDNMPVEPIATTVLFHLLESYDHGGWTSRFDLVTDAPLQDLLKIDRFHLPGETDREHAMRHNSYRWP